MDRILNLAPPPPDELVSASNLQEDSATGTEEETATEESGEILAQDSATGTEEEITEEEPGETPEQENDPETESPEETN